MSDSSSWYVYLLLCANDHLYCGVTNNIEKRVKQHNGELKGGAKYTRANRPCLLVYKEVKSTRSKALVRESEIKKLSREDKLVLISKQNQ